MASIVGATRLTARVIHRQSRRGFRAAAINHAAQNFTMPALSPTMTEGNIATWKVKEGDSFSAGDVLLEVETDKAQMDVEAQDDGIMAKIFSQDGSKAVKVGTRIAVIAEAGDDISSLEIPAEEAPKEAGQAARKDRPTPQEELKSGIDTTESSPSAAEAPPSSKPNADADAGGAADTTPATQKKAGSGSGKSTAKAQKQRYPLYPSVQHLLHVKGLPLSEADKIPASGPNGRLLKGDVLAYMGSIEGNYSSEQSTRIAKLGKMDLSNIQVAPAKKTEKTTAAPKEAAPAPEPDTEIALPISLSAVIATQKRVQDSLGIHLPLSTFIARASELANENLPASKRGPSADELFNSVVGITSPPRATKGGYFPNVTALPPVPLTTAMPRTKKVDIIDMLAPKAARTPKPVVPKLVGAEGVASRENVFSVVAKKGEEKRVEEYLGRMKLVLEGEPGRLVL
ncbi:hypothetical protein MBLNU457_1970t1 [Dothideomycetes sp. NU457]